MRRLSLLLALALPALAGCSLFNGGPDEAYMDRLDGVWSLSYEELRILDSGTVETLLEIDDAGTFTFAPSVTCPSTGFLLEGGESFSRAYTYEGDSRVVIPNMTAGCGIVFSDDPALRINFIATFGGDVLMTIDDDGSDEQVWSRYRLMEADGYVLHTRYTLRRQ